MKNLTGVCLSRLRVADLTGLSGLYQFVERLVKQNLCLGGTRLLVRAVFFLALFLAVGSYPGYCLTAEEIAYLKKAGVSDETIDLMIQQEHEKGRPSETGIWEVKDDQGNRSTLYRAGDGSGALERRQVEQEKVDRAWEMLKNLVIDAREGE